MAATNSDSPTPVSYAEALQRLLSLADYERMAGLAAPAYKHDLGRMRELARRTGDSQDRLRIVHIAGTKGKGSVAAMVTSIVRAAGQRVVTFTSPHLHTFRERLRIDGEPCTEAQFAAALSRAWPHVEAMATESTYGRPTTFELLTAMAFDMALHEQAGVLVLEAGLGGRLDSTNVARAAVSVITSISLDHTAILGDTLEEIAAEKAGIIKSASPVVAAPLNPEALPVVESAARAHEAPLVLAGRDVIWDVAGDDLTGQDVTVRTARGSYAVRLPLLGAHQRENAAVAIGAAEALFGDIPAGAVADGLRSVRWDARFQVVSTAPHVIVDGAHNADSVARLCDAVRTYFPGRPVCVLFGCSGDKPVQPMIEELAKLADEVVVSASHHPRAVPPETLHRGFEQAGIRCAIEADVAGALKRMSSRIGPDGVVLVTGSLFIAAEALEAWYGLPGERYPEFDPHRTATQRGQDG